MKQFYMIVVVLLFTLSQVMAGALAGKVTDKDTGEPLVGANIYIQGTTTGASTDADGMYYFEVDDGTYTVVCAFVGYVEESKQVTVSGTTQLDFALQSSVLKTSEIIVEASRAKDRETPVAFTDISADEIQRRFTIQDVPHLFKNTPGIYVTTDGGSGMGDSKVFIRGFDEQRISVMINNIEVNDPESKKVYWSNWGALPSGSQSIQVQRGAGSTLYGAGAFGGSINVLTAEAPAVSSTKIVATAGLYNTYKFGVDYNTGLFANDKLSFITRINYQTGNGWRQNTYYQGMSYYFGLSYFASENHTLRFVLHGAPQFHAYAFYSERAKNWAKYGRDWNPHPYVKDGDPGLTSREKDGTSLLDMLTFSHVNKDKGGEVIGNGYVSFDNNVYHKPQFEIHHTWDIDKDTYLQTNAFATAGRGYGEWVSSYYRIGRDKNGQMSMETIKNSGQYQYRAHSIHNQFGIVTTYNTKWNNHDLSFGAEGRYWWARHYGLVVNAFGNKYDTDVAKDNVAIRVGGVKGVFREGDIYYDYTGIKPNFSIFGHGLWKFDDLSIMTDLQYAVRMYNIKEDFPSSNNRPVDGGSYIPRQNLEGGNNDGFQNIDATYNLVNYKKTYVFVSPKFGANYNVNKNINLFANYSRVYNEPRVKYFFNYGQPNDDLNIEISDDYELGMGFVTSGFNFKLNLYRIDFQNKAYRVEDPSKANQPGYDYRGRRYVPVGTAHYTGVEFSTNMDLTRHLSFGAALTSMKNEWAGDLSEEATEQLGIKEGNIEPETPQFMLSGTLNYLNGPLYVSAQAKYHKDYYILPSNDYVDLAYDADQGIVTQRGATLPDWTVVDLVVGWQDKFGGVNIDASLHMNNLLNAEYWQIGNQYGLMPGAERNIIFQLTVGL